MKFTDKLWIRTLPIYHAILKHPFNQELMRGTLPKEKFQFYIKQDALYLTDFSRALALLAAKSSSQANVVMFLKFSEGAIVAERGLHEFYFQEFQTTLDVDYAPSCFAYTNYLLATASLRSYEEAAGALLPCFWIYREVGTYIYKNAAPNNPYQKWIDMYSSDEYGKVVDQAIDFVEALFDQSGIETRMKMAIAFDTSSRLEWLFWDGAYRMEQWKPEIA